MTAVSLGGRMVGTGHRCYVIAEAGSNHNRDLGTARRLIDVSVEAGADAVKFQTYSGRQLYSTKAPPFEYLGELGATPAHQLLEDISLPREWQPILAAHCRDAGIEFLSTPFDRAAACELDALDVAAFKVASFEIVDLAFLRLLGSYGRPLIISTGMANLGEIEEAMGAAREGGASDFCLLQCASLYPAPPRTLNLRSMDTMHRAFGVPVGLSDHSAGLHLASAAVGLGASLLEKHLTLDRTSPGPDHAFAIEPDELKQLVRNVREVEEALGDGRKQGPSDLEAKEMYAKGRRSVVAATAIPAGTVIARDMLTVKRPGHGIKPKYIDTIVGRRAAVDIDEDDIVTWEMV